MELRSIEWGDDSAERDVDLLSYFIDTESYDRLARKSKTIVIGRKGSGKSALRKKLENDFSKDSDTHVINISPKYSSIRNILNEKSLSEGFGEEIFFQHSWLRQMMLDSLCLVGHRTKGKYASESLEFARQISRDLNRTSKDLVENISEILSRIKAKAGNLGELGLHLEKELRNVADVDSLEHHLKEIANSGAKLVIMVDDLDLGWDNSEISNNLLLGLLSASSYMKSVSQNIHVFIFLREDVYSILMEKTQHSDKYRNVERIRWTKDGLISLLNERIRHNYRKNGEKCADHPFEHVFPVTVGTHNTDNWLVERTLSRPRELIQIARFYTEDVEGEEPQDDALKACEAAYSSWKLDDLCTEYSNQYPGLSDIFTYWKTKFFRYKYHLSRADVEEMIFQIFDEVAVNAEWFNELIAKLDFQGFLAILYEIGFLGDFVLGGEGGSKTFYSFSRLLKNYFPKPLILLVLAP
ncbi:P-loop ATPase, Sll1717 family [Geoalkalibacter halelectricus]